MGYESGLLRERRGFPREERNRNARVFRHVPSLESFRFEGKRERSETELDYWSGTRPVEKYYERELFPPRSELNFLFLSFPSFWKKKSCSTFLYIYMFNPGIERN